VDNAGAAAAPLSHFGAARAVARRFVVVGQDFDEGNTEKRANPNAGIVRPEEIAKRYVVATDFTDDDGAPLADKRKRRSKRYVVNTDFTDDDDDAGLEKRGLRIGVPVNTGDGDSS
jgi:hypothetical protein